MNHQSLSSRLRRLERSMYNEFQTVVALEDGTELTMDIRDLLGLVIRWNTLRFKELSEQILTENDLEWIDRLALAVPDPEEVSYALVMGAKKAAIEYLEDGEIQRKGK